ncbi:MAG: PqiC family protein [Gammaproteobacteria bacterium]
MKIWPTAAALLLPLCACVSSKPDHFYILSVLPQAVSAPRTGSAVQATLKVTVPSLMDRTEMVLNTSADGVRVLEHERWAVPLADLVTQTLARDIERRRDDVLVADRAVGRMTTIKITVDIVQLSMRRGAQASMEAHWRIRDTRTGNELVGGDVFTAPLGLVGYSVVAQTLSECLSSLADRLVGQIAHAE